MCSQVKDLARFFLSAALCVAPVSQGAEIPAGSVAVKVFKVGVLLSDTGELKDAGIEMRRAVDLAARDFDMKNKGKARMELVHLDDGSRVDGATAQAEALIRKHRVDAVVGPLFFAGVSVSAPLFEAARIPVVVPLARSGRWGAGKNTRFLGVDEFRRGEALGKFSRTKLSARVAVLVDELSSDSSRAFNDGFAKAFVTKKTSLKQRLGFVSAAEEATRRLAEIAAIKPDVVALPTTSWEGARAFLDAAPVSGVSAVFLGSSAWAPSSEAPDAKPVAAPVGHFFADDFAPDNPLSRDFVEAYRKAYSLQASRVAALSFEAVSILGQAFVLSKLQSGAALQKALAASHGFNGVSGKLRFRSDSTPDRAILVRETTQSGVSRLRSTEQ